MKFTPEQRFIVAMICDLARDKSSRELDFEFINAAVLDGHDWALEWKYSGLIPSEVDSKEDVSFVTDVLDMWRFIEAAFKSLDPIGKADLKTKVPYGGDNPTFTGFDGNNETELMSITRFMVEELGRFESFKGRNFNSHHPTVGRYNAMLQIFNGIRPGLAGREMTVSELVSVLSAV